MFNKWLNAHSVLMTIIMALISAMAWVLTSYATVDYVDKGRSQDREMMQEIRADVKTILNRLPRR